MNIEYLKVVLAVYRTGSFSKAAFELYTSQSSVSKNVAKVEDELQIKLFDRNNGIVTLTPGGHQLIRPIEAVVDAYDSMMCAALQCTERGGQKLVVSTTPLAPGLHLTDLFYQCSKAFPLPQIMIHESTTRGSIAALENGEADLAITVQTYINDVPCGPFSISTDPKFLLQPLFRDDYYVIVPSGHPFASREYVDLTDLYGERLIMVDKSFASYHTMMEKAFALANIQPHIALTASTISAVLNLVANNMGISVLTKRVSQDSAGVVLVPLSHDSYHLRRETALVCIDRKPMPRVLKWMMDYVKQQTWEPKIDIT